MYAFSLPVYVLLGVPLIVGVDALLSRARARLAAPLLATFALPVLLYTGVARFPPLHALLTRYVGRYPEAAYVADLWDPAVYVMNPVRPGYREAERYCLGLMRILPRGTDFWDNDTRADYPLRYYYQEVLGRNLGFELHSQFSLSVTEESARQDARDMLHAMRTGRAVVVSTLGFPMREVLNQLWLLLEPSAVAGEVRGLSAAEFRRRAPFSVADVPVDPGRPWVVHRLGVRG
jgi:hypothetical protein